MIRIGDQDPRYSTFLEEKSRYELGLTYLLIWSAMKQNLEDIIKMLKISVCSTFSLLIAWGHYKEESVTCPLQIIIQILWRIFHQFLNPTFILFISPKSFFRILNF